MKKIFVLFALATSTLFAQQADSVKTVVPASVVTTQSFSKKMHERFAKEGLKIYLSKDSSQWLSYQW
jgi:hypothetical protein